MQTGDGQHFQRPGLFGGAYLERLKEGDSAMLVPSGLGSTGTGGSGGAGGGGAGASGFGSGSIGGGGMTMRKRSTRGSRRNLREWSSDSENEFGQDEDADSVFGTDVGSVRQGSETAGEQVKGQDVMSGIGLQQAYESMQRRGRRRTAHWHLRDDQAAWLSDQEELLVPIRLEMEVGDYRLHDVFVWNAKERVITPEQFAAIYCADLSLPATGRAGAQEYIAQLIRQQVAEHVAATEWDFTGAELRVNLNLEVQVGTHVLRDRIEWDILEPLGSKPEEFARTLCRDLGLGGEYPPLVAHRVREEISRMHKELSEAGDAHWLRQQPVDSIFRPINMAEAWGPSVEIMSAEDLDRMWMHKERSYRRMRRSERSHTRTFNFLPPELVSREPGAVAAGSAVPGISLTFYTQAAPQTPTSAVAGSIDGGPGSGASTPRPTRRTNSTSRVPGTPTRSTTPRLYSKVDIESWECEHCGCNGEFTPTQRLGPNGAKTLCNACGIAWVVRNRQELPSHRKDLFRK
ncbi:Chromatin structure remodeling complex protein sfh1 [Coemansia sp. RSA 1813]|nr:Chromatin structure remodeling complex protein sfh1 [Coemansia sp. RSA 1646]KAJ1769263.1 Chromatin structure remodeling complex protein sfh1 [Coemansia sp. RSA 1843]KAJ2090303.1 Chromatin structure remodeling complex protein sfh1 [Coemansia sp. RSA 986]KAJ2215493.1 Chromatin structure remodeling complex protein sfh1 [Coemansia sp. RSA 487]KAJ2566089.1 Chromatin structure remodeling complex protein sfh1 [Coemansia sp. RSA 1813]